MSVQGISGQFYRFCNALIRWFHSMLGSKREPSKVQFAVWAVALNIAGAITATEVELGRFDQVQECNLRLLTSWYLDSVSATVLQALGGKDAQKVFDVPYCAQSDRYHAGFQSGQSAHSGFVVELPNGTVPASDLCRFPVQSAVPDELRERLAAGDGLVMDVDNGRAWMARTLRTEGVPVGRLFAEADIAHSVQHRHEFLHTLVLVNGCLALALAFGGYFGYFALKRMVDRPFLEGLRHGTAGRIANLASWIVIALLLVTLFNLRRHFPDRSAFGAFGQYVRPRMRRTG
jgi:hypothetical protein